MKHIIDEKIEYYEGLLSIYLNDFLKSNKRIDRDKVLTTKARLESFELFSEILNKQIN